MRELLMVACILITFATGLITGHLVAKRNCVQYRGYYMEERRSSETLRGERI